MKNLPIRRANSLASLSLLTALAVAGCGGGGLSGDDDDNDRNNGGDGGGSSAPAPTQQAEGIWEGTATESDETFNVLGLLYDGDLYFVSYDLGVLYRGSYRVSGSTLTSSLRSFDEYGPFSSTELSATVVEKTSIEGETENHYEDGTTRGRIDLSYDPVYERDASLERLASSWFYTDGDYSNTITIQRDGTIGGTDSDNCRYSGRASIPDPSVNVYRLNVTVSGCEYNGDYTGYGAVVDYETDGDNNGLAVMIASDDYMLASPFVRK